MFSSAFGGYSASQYNIGSFSFIPYKSVAYSTPNGTAYPFNSSNVILPSVDVVTDDPLK